MIKNTISFHLICILLVVGILKTSAIEYKVPTQQDIKIISTKVADWQISSFRYSATGNLHDNGIASWAHSPLYLGLFEWAKIQDEENVYSDWLYNHIGRNSDWQLNGIYPYHADEFCVAQFYASMYEKYDEESILTNTLERVENVMTNTLNQSMAYNNKQRWTWCDALFMAPPLYAQLSKITNDNKYLEYMDTEFKATYNHLFDHNDKLFFRDDSYFNKTEANGKKVFWGRGNGWALAGIANILKNLPEDSEYQWYYNDIFQELALSLINLQDKTGAWHASLLDPESYPAPESSATALITYALAYGLNNGLLDESQAYRPVLKAWNKLCDAVHENGKLGWVQPIGQDPKTITKDMTATFGVGAFLMAAAEIHKLIEKEFTLEPEIEFLSDHFNIMAESTIQAELCLFAPLDISKIEWHSSNNDIAEVDQDGVILGISRGEAIITAIYTEDRSITASCPVTVSSKEYFTNVFFDFGSASSPVSENALKVSSLPLFSENGLYGWISNAGIGERYLSRPADNIELRGFVACRIPATFKVMLENGGYAVAVTQGDADYPHEYMIIKANGVTKFENITATKDNYEINTFDIEISNNALELEFSKLNQGDPNWVVNSVKIEERELSNINTIVSMDYFKNPNTQITLFTLEGRKISEEKLGGRNPYTLMNYYDVPKGVYIIRYQLDGKIKVVKFVK